MSGPLDLPAADKLKILRARDIFHRWESIDERRLCRRCGQIITGREIKVVGGRGEEGDLHLECPTEGCPSVPIEWIMVEALDGSEPVAPQLPPRPEKNGLAAPGRDGFRLRQRPGIFGFRRIGVFVF